jgi:Ca2+-binding RTX toxin-like protein
MRTITLSAAALLGAALLVPTGAASGAGETCQGQPASIMGTAGQSLVATEGADVIVTNGATEVDALGGDDLVCVTGATTAYPTVDLDAGPGNDSVEVAAPKWSVAAVLGVGDDAFVSTNSWIHTVWAGTRLLADGRTSFQAAETTDTGADVIRIGGDVSSKVFSGTAGQPNADVIDVGVGAVSWQGHQVVPGGVTSSKRRSSLTFSSTATSATLDARGGTMKSADTSLAFSGSSFKHYSFSTPVRRGKLTFRGTGRAEQLEVDAPMTFNRHVDLAGGGDVYMSNSLGGKNSRVDGGPGKDSLQLDVRDYKVTADLERSRYIATKDGTKTSGHIRAFEETTLAAKRASIAGTDGRDRILLWACQARVDAKKGNDFIGVDPSDNSIFEPMTCPTSRAVIFGGPGSDTIEGGPGNDRLIGGPGKDSVDGYIGRDVCQGEKVRFCEKRT